MQDFSLLIDGQLVAGDAQMSVINPATAAPFAFSPAASASQLDAAIAAAMRAFPAWRGTPFEARREVVLKMADAIAAHREALAEILTLEHGKPTAAALAEIDGTVNYFRYFATLTLESELIEDSDTRRVEIRREPLGVIAAIIPWNFPLLLMAFKLPAALLAGNTAVLKPATSTPLTTLAFARLVADIVPTGVVNVIAGTDELGPLLTAHPDIRKVSFTGSTETGKRVMVSAAPTLKRLTLELGGNDPAIVLGDVDVAKTAELVFAAAFNTCGQVCRAIKRLYVHASIYEDFCSALAQRAQRSVVDDGRVDGVEFGPVQNAAQFRRLKSLFDDSLARGTVMPGGGPVDREGYFFRPTIVKDIAEESRLVVEEQFGPILPVMFFTDLDEVIYRANASPYGLAASVWTKDMKLAFEVADRLVAGTVWINKHTDRTPHLPVAGAKQSGMGVELGIHGLHDFTQIKVVNASAPT